MKAGPRMIGRVHDSPYKSYPERDPKELKIERLERQVDRLIRMNDYLRGELEGDRAA